MFSVNDVIYHMHHFEEENFEKFDELYDNLKAEKSPVEEKAVYNLVKSFDVEFDQIHPHQYIKAQKMTFILIERMGYEAGFSEFIDALNDINDERYIYEYMKMFIYSYEEDILELFKRLMLTKDDCSKIQAVIDRLLDTDSDKGRLDCARMIF